MPPSFPFPQRSATTRREFLVRAMAAGLAAGGFQRARGADTSTRQSADAAPNLRISSVSRRDETILRLGGNGDNWHMSWAADDRQYVSLCDGFGWPGLPGYDMKGKEFNSRLYAISGGPKDAVFSEVQSYPWLVREPQAKEPRYYAFGTLALDGRIYQYLSTLNREGEQSLNIGAPTPRFMGAKLIFSPDNGRTWCNQDGSTPVRWEDWSERTRDTMVFLDEDQGSFSFHSVLQMGKNYADNRDGYVYVYSPNGTVDGTMNELAMFRVPKGQILRRSAYEYFAGIQPRGGVRWTREILDREVVHRFPRGWVGVPGHPYGWIPSLAYNAPLDLYMMANWGMGTNSASEWFVKPSYLGIWVSRHPWGPWTQIHEDTAWAPAGDVRARAYNPQIAPKWISKDGKSFWLVWTDFQLGEPFPKEEFSVETKQRALPYYAFNTQRVDLSVI